MVRCVPRRPLALLVGVLACLAGGAGGGPLIAGASAQDAATSEALVLGDSLAVGMRSALGPRLAGRPASYSVRSGITTPQGITRLQRALTRTTPDVVVVSLGTNDGSDPFRFAIRMDRVLELVPRRACVVWPAIHRAPRKGAFRALNRVLRAKAREDDRLHVVGWDRMVDSGRVRLPDGVHPDAAGYRARAQAVSRAARSACPAPLRQIDGGAVAST